MEFSRQDHWSGLLFPSPGKLPDPGIKHVSATLQAEPLPSEPPKFRTLTSNSVKNVEQQELSSITGWDAKWYSYFGRKFSSFLQN